MQKRILLKITGELLSSTHDNAQQRVRSIAQQIKKLSQTHNFGLVMGGGNFFRGNHQGVTLGLEPHVSHQVGMLATLMNALIVHNIFTQEGIASTILTALDCPSIATTLSPQALENARKETCVIFAGGIGTPFFTTDTAAIIRGLQIDAHEVWKATKIDGVYTADPTIDTQAQFMPRLSYTEALDRHLGILDSTALMLAQEQKITMRVFSAFASDALIQAADNPHFGSTLYPT